MQQLGKETLAKCTPSKKRSKTELVVRRRIKKSKVERKKAKKKEKEEVDQCQSIGKGTSRASDWKRSPICGRILNRHRPLILGRPGAGNRDVHNSVGRFKNQETLWMLPPASLGYHESHQHRRLPLCSIQVILTQACSYAHAATR